MRGTIVKKLRRIANERAYHLWVNDPQFNPQRRLAVVEVPVSSMRSVRYRLGLRKSPKVVGRPSVHTIYQGLKREYKQHV